MVKNPPDSAGDKRCGFHPWVGKIRWRTKCQPTSVFLPGESYGQRSMEDYSPWGCQELDTTEAALAALNALKVVGVVTSEHPTLERIAVISVDCKLGPRHIHSLILDQ